VLLGGEPGIGKSTLLLQCLAGLARRAGSVLYVSGEESLEQVALRAERLGLSEPGLLALAETRLSSILSTAARKTPRVVAVDSVQTLQVDDASGAPGSPSLVREATAALLAYAKSAGVPLILVGHVTKEGGLAGPKTLEHLVDAVLHFEGEQASSYRVLRATKNRFGSTNEIGVFEMGGTGLREVKNPSALFLAERASGVAGSAVVACVEGSRPILVEVQALTCSASGVPRRAVLGVDPYRVALLLAVCARRAGVDVLDSDVFVNVAGGVRLDEPAADLGVIAALVSSASNRPVDADTVCFGEVGLAGEVRATGAADLRLAEAQRLGFRRVILPTASAQQAQDPRGLELVGVRDVGAALAALLV
jgi:DNA repair protein RadA/Sms